MKIQIQTCRLGTGFATDWKVYGQWHGQTLPKYAQQELREIRQQNNEEARVVKSSNPEFIKEEAGR